MKVRHAHHLSLPFALPVNTKIAHVSSVPEFSGAEAFPRVHWSEIASFQPGVIVGYGYDLAVLARAVSEDQLAKITVERAIFVLTDCGMPMTRQSLRHELWNVFGVPVYELIVAPGCTIFAAECELHSGWHLQAGFAAYVSDGEIVYDLKRLEGMRTGYHGTFDMVPCECGRNTPRLQSLTPLVRRHVSAAPVLRAS